MKSYEYLAPALLPVIEKLKNFAVSSISALWVGFMIGCGFILAHWLWS